MVVSKKPILFDWPIGLAACSIEAALSGGLDSVVLLHRLVALRQQGAPLTLSALHVHHGLQAVADQWVDFCQQLCARWQVPLRVEYVRVSAQGNGLEAAARHARYAAFATSPAQIIALAHHANDQAETVLLHALRGGGSAALAAMPTWRPLHKPSGQPYHGQQPTTFSEAPYLWRPLLSYSRAQLADYAQQHQLTWQEDPSNQQLHWRRNVVRHQLLPAIEPFWPQALTQLQQTAQQAAREHQLLDEYSQADLQHCGATATTLPLHHWQHLSPLRQQAVLIAFLRQCSTTLPSTDAIAQFCHDCQHATPSAQPTLRFGRWQLFRYRQQLYVWQPPTTIFPTHTLTPPESIELGYGRLSWHSQLGRGIAAAVAAKGLTLRPRQAGESITIAGIGRRPLKKLFQEAGVPLAWRDVWPVLSQGQDIVALPGIAIAAPYQAGAEEIGHWPQWDMTPADSV